MPRSRTAWTHPVSGTAMTTANMCTLRHAVRFQRLVMPPPIGHSSAERLDQLRSLARRLEDRLLVNTRAGRADCRTFALQIIELLEIEEREGQFEPLHAMKRDVIERVCEASARAGRRESRRN